MQHFKFDMRAWTQLASLLAATSLFSADAMAAKMTGDPATTCSGLAGPADNAVRIDSAAIVAPTPLAVAERGPTPAARVTPANPEFCKVLGQIAPTRSQCAADQIPGESPDRSGTAARCNMAAAASTAC